MGLFSPNISNLGELRSNSPMFNGAYSQLGLQKTAVLVQSYSGLGCRAQPFTTEQTSTVIKWLLTKPCWEHCCKVGGKIGLDF